MTTPPGGEAALPPGLLRDRRSILMGYPVRPRANSGLEWIVHPHSGRTMADAADYWFAEGTYAFKAGISLSELVRHYPERDMNPREWSALERGWVAEQTKSLEDNGQTRLF